MAARREGEIGIRMALGADRSSILRLVFRDAALVLAAGCMLGWMGTVGSRRFFESLLFSVSASDPGMFALSVGVMITVAGTASYLPARRAANINPVSALRGE